jgi:hemerythrin-like metal-binding protein
MATAVKTTGSVSGEYILDHEHKEIEEAIQALRQAILHGSGLAVILSTADELIFKTEEHFRQEERLLRSVGFPGLREHLVSHAELRSELDQIRHNLTGRQLQAALLLIRRFSDSMKRHTDQEDSKYEYSIRRFLYGNEAR